MRYTLADLIHIIMTEMEKTTQDPVVLMHERSMLWASQERIRVRLIQCYKGDPSEITGLIDRVMQLRAPKYEARNGNATGKQSLPRQAKVV